MKTAASAIAIIAVLGLSVTAASAACNVTATTIASHIASGAHTETDCASATDVANQGAAITTLQGDVTTLQGTVVTQGNDIAALQTGKADVTYVDSQNAAQDAVIATKADTTYVDSQNAAQDTVIATKASTAYVDSENAAQNTVINSKVDKTRIDTFKPTGAVGPYSTLENWAGGVNSQLGTHNEQIAALNTLTASQGAAISANTAMLSEHSAKLDEHSRGLAIAAAMPDAWLSDKKSFGIFGAVGGFDDEMAVGFAAIGRLDETFTLNAKIGTDFEGKNFGWQVGAGAQW